MTGWWERNDGAAGVVLAAVARVSEQKMGNFEQNKKRFTVKSEPFLFLILFFLICLIY